MVMSILPFRKKVYSKEEPFPVIYVCVHVHICVCTYIEVTICIVSILMFTAEFIWVYIITVIKNPSNLYIFPNLI